MKPAETTQHLNVFLGNRHSPSVQTCVCITSLARCSRCAEGYTADGHLFCRPQISIYLLFISVPLPVFVLHVYFVSLCTKFCTPGPKDVTEYNTGYKNKVHGARIQYDPRLNDTIYSLAQKSVNRNNVKYFG
jgi:hypothetical protein